MSFMSFSSSAYWPWASISVCLKYGSGRERARFIDHAEVQQHQVDIAIKKIRAPRRELVRRLPLLRAQRDFASVESRVREALVPHRRLGELLDQLLELRAGLGEASAPGQFDAAIEHRRDRDRIELVGALEAPRAPPCSGTRRSSSR
jgi:hypothetical protein